MPVLLYLRGIEVRLIMMVLTFPLIMFCIFLIGRVQRKLYLRDYGKLKGAKNILVAYYWWKGENLRKSAFQRHARLRIAFTYRRYVGKLKQKRNNAAIIIQRNWFRYYFIDRIDVRIPCMLSPS
jgi:hypothetical protein